MPAGPKPAWPWTSRPAACALWCCLPMSPPYAASEAALVANAAAVAELALPKTRRLQLCRSWPRPKPCCARQQWPKFRLYPTFCRRKLHRASARAGRKAVARRSYTWLRHRAARCRVPSGSMHLFDRVFSRVLFAGFLFRGFFSRFCFAVFFFAGVYSLGSDQPKYGAARKP